MKATMLEEYTGKGSLSSAIQHATYHQEQGKEVWIAWLLRGNSQIWEGTRDSVLRGMHYSRGGQLLSIDGARETWNRVEWLRK